MEIAPWESRAQVFGSLVTGNSTPQRLHQLLSSRLVEERILAQRQLINQTLHVTTVHFYEERNVRAACRRDSGARALSRCVFVLPLLRIHEDWRRERIVLPEWATKHTPCKLWRVKPWQRHLPAIYRDNATSGATRVRRRRRPSVGVKIIIIKMITSFI